MEWLAPVAALVGVIVGGVLNAALGAEFERRRELVAGAVSARLIAGELEQVDATVNASLEAGRWGAVLDPGLPYSRGLWAVEHREGQREGSAWTAFRMELATCLTFDEWVAVARPYELIDRIGLKFWTDNPDREISEEERQHFSELRSAIPAAVAAMAPVARGERRTRLQRMLPALTRQRGEGDVGASLARAK